MAIAHTDVSAGLGTIYIEKGRLQFLSFGKEFRAAYNDLEHKKVGGFSGPVAAITDWGGDVSADEAVAFANDGEPPGMGEFDPVKYLVESHRAVALKSSLLGRLEGNLENLLTTTQAKTDLAIEAVLDETERELWSDGYNAICQITNTGFSTTIATITPASAAKFVRRGQHLVSASSKTAALNDSGKSLEVASKDPINGTITFTDNLSTVSGLNTNHYLFQKGNAINGGSTRKGIMGFEAWASSPSPGENFMGQDRSVDPANLAMLTGTGSINNIQWAIEQNAAKVYDINGGMVDRAWLNPQDMSLLSQQMGVAIQQSPGSKAQAGFSFMTINGVGGKPITVKCTPYLARNKMHLHMWSSWKLAHLWDQAVTFDKTDGNLARKLEASSGIQIRVFSFRQLYSTHPGKNIAVTLS